MNNHKYKEGYENGVLDCLNVLQIYLHDIFTIDGVEKTMKYLKEQLQKEDIININLEE